MLAQCTAAKLGDVTRMSSRTRSYANVGELWYVGMSYVAMSHVACRNLAMSNNLHTAIYVASRGASCCASLSANAAVLAMHVCGGTRTHAPTFPFP